MIKTLGIHVTSFFLSQIQATDFEQLEIYSPKNCF